MDRHRRRAFEWDTVAPVDFQVIGTIRDAETIATGRGIREIARLRKVHGPGRGRKRKGIGRIRLFGLQMVGSAPPSSTGTRRTASAEKN